MIIATIKDVIIIAKSRKEEDNMELIKILNKQGVPLQVIYQRQGNDKNGNPIYIINVFKNNLNVNYFSNRKKDKYNNIKIQSYNIEGDVQHICDYMDFSEFI